MQAKFKALLVTPLLSFALMHSVSALAETPHHTVPDGLEKLAECVDLLNDKTLLSAGAITGSIAEGSSIIHEAILTSRFSNTSEHNAIAGDNYCLGLNWTRYYSTEGSTSGVSANDLGGNFSPTMSDDGWDCNHSSITYGLFTKTTTGWMFAGGGQSMGRKLDNECQFWKDGFPGDIGESFTANHHPNTTGEYLIAFSGWQHDTPGLGHVPEYCPHPVGDNCTDPEHPEYLSCSCYWPLEVSVVGLAEEPAPFSMTAGHSHRITSYSGQCLDIRGSQFWQSEADIIGWSCHGGINQNFFLDENRNLRDGSGKCVSIVGNAQPQQVKMTACANVGEQKWTISGSLTEGGTIQSDTGKCLEINSGALYAKTCSGSALQKWAYKRGESVNIQVQKFTSSDPDFCLDISNSSSDEDTPISGYWCDARSNQQWSFVYTGSDQYQLRSNLTGKCATFSEGRLKQRTCSSNADQKFILESHQNNSFNVKSAATGQCLSYKYPSTRTYMKTCDSTDSTQRWFESNF